MVETLGDYALDTTTVRQGVQMVTNLTDSLFSNKTQRASHFEAIRWADGRVCLHCGTIGNSTLMNGKTTRPGFYKCKTAPNRSPP